jgi:hypothetical protein
MKADNGIRNSGKAGPSNTPAIADSAWNAGRCLAQMRVKSLQNQGVIPCGAMCWRSTIERFSNPRKLEPCPPKLLKTGEYKCHFLRLGTRCAGGSIEALRMLRDSIGNCVKNQNFSLRERDADNAK